MKILLISILLAILSSQSLASNLYNALPFVLVPGVKVVSDTVLVTASHYTVNCENSSTNDPAPIYVLLRKDPGMYKLPSLKNVIVKGVQPNPYDRELTITVRSAKVNQREAVDCVYTPES